MHYFQKKFWIFFIITFFFKFFSRNTENQDVKPAWFRYLIFSRKKLTLEREEIGETKLAAAPKVE